MFKPSHKIPLSSFATAIFCAALSLALCACKSMPGSSHGSYDSAKDLHRDTDLARKLTGQASTLIDQGKWPEAQETLQKALDADVTYGQAHNNLGTLYLPKNNLYQAAWEFQYPAKLMPYQPEPRSNLGLALEAAGKLDEAVDNYDQALKIEPDNPQFLGNDARARIRRGDRDTAVRQLLSKLVATDTRPDWLAWARQKLVLMSASPATEPQGLP